MRFILLTILSTMALISNANQNVDVDSLNRNLDQDIDKFVKGIFNEKYAIGAYGRLPRSESLKRHRGTKAARGELTSYDIAVLYGWQDAALCLILNSREKKDKIYVDACHFLRFMQILMNAKIYGEGMMKDFTKKEFYLYQDFMNKEYVPSKKKSKK